MKVDRIRDASSVVLLRGQGPSLRILMGRRPLSAAFMPGALVFPGGAVDASDVTLDLGGDAQTMAQLSHASTVPPRALLSAALRELFEETGQMLGSQDLWQPPADADPIWREVARRGWKPQAQGLSMFLRAVTPPGRTRRFDARFFIVDAAGLVSDPDRLVPVAPELEELGWRSLDEARDGEIAFITRIAIEEIAAYVSEPPPTQRAFPFIRPGGPGGLVSHFMTPV